MDAACVYKAGSMFFVKIVQIGDVLEIVGVKVAAVYYQVRLYIIFKNGNVQFPSLFLKEGSRLLQNLRMGSCRRCNGDCLVVLRAYENRVARQCSQRKYCC